jgi:hypothetical protein
MQFVAKTRKKSPIVKLDGMRLGGLDANAEDDNLKKNESERCREHERASAQADRERF